MADKVPVLKIEVTECDTGDVLETLYTDGAALDVCNALHEHAVVYDTKAECEAAQQEGDDRG